MTLAERIKEAIDGSGKSQAQIARECHVSSTAVGSWLSGGTKELSGENPFLLEDATGYCARWLATGKGPKRVGDPLPPPEPYWPFARVSIEAFQALGADDQGYVQRRLMQAIEECSDLPPAVLPRRRRLSAK